MKKLVLSLLTISVLAVSCKKNDQKEDDVLPEGGIYSIEGKTYSADYTYWTAAEGLVITNIPRAPEYIENSIKIAVDSIYFSDTFTYMGRTSTDYNNRKNFCDAIIKYTPSGVYGNGFEIAGVSKGTLNVSLKDQIFTIKFDMIVAGRPVTGTYVGKVAGKKWQ